MKPPKGYLVAIGGNEDKGQGTPEHLKSTNLDFLSEGVLKEIRNLMPEEHPIIEIITTASETPEEYFENYKKAFKKLGATAQHLDIRSRLEADNPKVLQRLAKCSGIMITGGDQTRLTSMLGGTKFLDIIKERYLHERFVVGGTSAGATCMSDIMMESGRPEKGNLKGEVNITLGLGFIEGILIDTHFDSRGRFNRLAEAIASQPGIIGFGLGEDTGIIIENGKVAKAIGADSITVLDGSNLSYTNIAEVKEGKPVTIAKMEVYLISRFDSFDLTSRAFTASPEREKLV